MQHSTQLYFQLSSPRYQSFDYFVSHSGVSAAVFALENAIANYLNHKPSNFSPGQYCQVYLYGLPKSGKSHLLQAACGLLEKYKIPSDLIVTSDIPVAFEPEIIGDHSDATDGNLKEWTASFITLYDTLRARGGVLFLSSHFHPQELLVDAHVKSRLVVGSIYQLSYPREDELEPLLYSLLERYHLKLSTRDLNFLLQQLPANPLSFDNIFAKISELSFEQNKPARRSLIKDAVNFELRKKKT